MRKVRGLRGGGLWKASAAACAAAVLSGWGCTATREIRKGPPPAVSLTTEAPQPPVPLPDAPLEAVEEAKQSPEEFRKAARKYTLVMAGADARELFLSLAKENDFNLVLSPEVAGTVTMDIKEATAPEIMAEVCGLLGCRVETAGKTVRVLPDRRVTRIFRVDYLLTGRAGSGSLTASTSTGGNSGSTASAGTSTGVSAAGSSSGESESRNTINTDEKFDLWAGIQEEVQSLLSGADAKAVANRAAGTIVVFDYPANIDRVAEYLRVLESRTRAGVLIESRILEVTLDDTTQYGINWGAFPSVGTLSGTLSGGFAVRQNLPSGNSAFQFGVAGSQFDAFIDALAQQGQINVLSAPKVSTLNNQKAIIRIGRQDVFFRAVVTPATTTSAAFVTFTPDTITEGIILTVTPQIGRDGTIMLSIHPSITEKVGQATAPDGNTAPIVDVRETNTVVTVPDGQTVFIGGLMQERTQETVKAVPFLGDIPFLGALFRTTDQQKKKTELVILITPRLLAGTAAAEAAADGVSRLRAAERGFHAGGRPQVYGTEGELKGLTPWD